MKPQIQVEEGRSTGPLALLSAALAASCCVLPPLLILLGLGSLGAGAFLGRWALPLLGVALILLALSWWIFLREARKLRGLALPMKNERRTRASLVFATAVIVLLAGLQGYSRAKAAWERSVLAAAGGGVPVSQPGRAHVVIGVEGMDCVTCEYPIERALRAVPGVLRADASIATHTATVEYDPSRVSEEEIYDAIDTTGYRAVRGGHRGTD